VFHQRGPARTRPLIIPPSDHPLDTAFSAQQRQHRMIGVSLHKGQTLHIITGQAEAQPSHQA